MNSDVFAYSNEETVDRIINLNESLEQFWANSLGWAPQTSEKLLHNSRLDRQSSLSRCLKIFLDSNLLHEEGLLILGWATLGALIEGTIKLYLIIWYDDYQNEDIKIDLPQLKTKKGLIQPEDLNLEKLKAFLANRIYKPSNRELYKMAGSMDWIQWIDFIQKRRNAIHAIKSRAIGSHNEFFTNLKKYLLFCRDITSSFPYPDEGVNIPSEIFR